MNKLTVSFCICLLLAATALQAQDLYMPRNIRNAYNKGTRSPEGLPSAKYWQNKARYSIAVTVAPPNRTIKGTEDITYFNNSPDTLRNLVIKLILNIHRPDALRYADASEAYLTEGIRIDAVTVNGRPVAWNDPQYHFTWQDLRLPTPLQPHDSVKLNFSWHYDISLQSNREGMIDSTTYFLAYFYPRVAVYDDYYGWDRLDFTDQQEFYNDFNDYTLQVTVPDNYVVWSTGTLQNASAVLQPAVAKKLAASFTSDEISTIATERDMAAGNVTTHQRQNTWTWTANHITDMTAAISDHFTWDASSVVVDPATGRRASVQAAYNDTAKDFHSMVAFGRHSLDWLSRNWPGIPYPYPKTTIVQGYADMEYPMMVNDATQADPDFARFVAEHEIAHTWFPFYMGINEARYAFMDEGWATTFELLIGREDLGVERAENFYRRFRVQSWIGDKSAEEDLPIITPANVLRGEGYGANAYGKPSLGYLALKDLLGDDLFKKCLHDYINRWNGKHPIPWDFFYSFNNSAGKDLNWFWKSWFFSNNHIDMAIADVKPANKGYQLTLRNIGGYPAPVDLLVSYADGSTETLHQGPGTWQNNPATALIGISTKKKIQSVRLQGGIFMDANTANDVWKAP
ncbi:MAG TPA: M1 family metallopeptidase [Chitinophagaceae bacterium]|nr:M1 family metallopeptidase [Chitinophagaceae bacterium]